MKNLDEIHDFIKESAMILIINNNSKSLLDYFFDFIYKKYTLPKCKIDSSKGLMLRLSKIKNKLIRLDFDLKKIQFSSSNTASVIRANFNDMQIFLSENNSKILLKIDISTYKFYTEITNRNLEYTLHNIIPQYDVFDFILLIDKNDIKILKCTRHHSSCIFNSYGIEEDKIYSIDKLLRSVKLRKIQMKTGKE